MQSSVLAKNMKASSTDPVGGGEGISSSRSMVSANSWLYTRHHSA